MLNWIKKKVTKEEPQKEVQDDPPTMIWGVLQGPILARDIPDCNFPDGATMMVMKVSRGTEVFDAEFWFDSFEDAYTLEKRFKDSFEPIELNNSKEP